MPGIQMYVLRIIFICPTYAACSSAAMALGLPNGMYIEFFRDLYEAFVVYSLLNLVMSYCGGEVDCVYAIENEPALKMPCPFCFLKPRPRDAKLLRFCQRGVLQFVLVKPLMAFFDVLMLATGNYYNPVFQAIEIFIYNASYGCALYGLLTFLLATKTYIKKFNPICKTVTVKLIIFTSFYQSLAVQLIQGGPEVQFAWKNLLLCVEMMFFSIAMWCAFPISEFMAGIPDRRFLANIKDLLTVNDIYEGFQHNFKPVYRDYALQRSQNEAPETVRLRTYFVGNVDNVALEMTERYRGRSKRLAFNSLLRGTKPISAGLRKNRQCAMTDDGEEDIEYQDPCSSSSACSSSSSMSPHDDAAVTANAASFALVSDDQSEEEEEKREVVMNPLASRPLEAYRKILPILAPPNALRKKEPEVVGRGKDEDGEPLDEEWGDFS